MWVMVIIVTMEMVLVMIMVGGDGDDGGGCGRRISRGAQRQSPEYVACIVCLRTAALRAGTGEAQRPRERK